MRKKTCRNRYGARILIFAAICMMMLAGSAAAYEIVIDTPMKVQKGIPLVVNGTSNLPPGISVDIVLYRSDYVTEEVARETVTLQGKEDFSVIFDTKDLRKGQYKVEVPGIAGYSYLGNSVTIRVLEIIDRTDEIVIRSPTTQEMDGTMEIRGYIKGISDAGVQIEVIGPGDQVVSGPEYIPTQYDGSFAKEVAINGTGTYEVSFTDAKGYIGTVEITVNEPFVRATTIVTTAPPARTTISAKALSSNDEPAEFLVTADPGNIRVYTSSGEDWVIEYTDSAGAVQKINNKGRVEGEETVIETDGGTTHIRVYPYGLSASGEVTLYAEGATSIEAGGPATEGTTGTTETSPDSPPWIFLPILAIALLAVWRIRKR